MTLNIVNVTKVNVVSHLHFNISKMSYDPYDATTYDDFNGHNFPKHELC